MTHYSIKSRTRKYVKRYGLWSIGRNLSNKYENQSQEGAIKTGLNV